MNEVSRILSAIEQGDPHAAEQLLVAGLRGDVQADSECPSISHGILITFLLSNYLFRDRI